MDWMTNILMNPSLMGSIGGDPATFAQQAAAAGIAPPPLPPTPNAGLAPGGMGPTIEQMNGVAPAMPGAPTTLGGAMEPQTMPKMPGQANLGGLAAAARPQTPQPQRVSTPAAPRPTQQIRTGELLALLQALGGGMPQPDPYRLPTTLGTAMGR